MANIPAEPEFSANVLAFLNEINGQDTYDAQAVSIGKLDRIHHLKVPRGFLPNDTDPGRIGLIDARPNWTNTLYAQIYAMNKPVFGSENEQIRGALLRVELVKAGWYTSNYEVTMEDPPANYSQIFETDLEAISRVRGEAARLAILLPLAAEHTFRTMGHHYITGLSADYMRKYANFFNAATEGALVNYLPPDILFHRVAHWVSLSLALRVVNAPAQVAKLPNAVRIRGTAAPAGTAIIATSTAILDAMQSTGLGAAVERASGANVAELRRVANAIKLAPASYHTIPSAYDARAVDGNALEMFNRAKETAQKLAPVLQGFVDSLPRNSQLSGARALIKHADTNPLFRKRARVFFSEVGKSKARNVDELFATNRRDAQATGGEGAIDLDDDGNEE